MVALAAFVSWIVVPAVFAQQQDQRRRSETIVPLARVLSDVERRYGVAVTYEDPVYEHVSELREVPPLPSSPNPSRGPILIPRGGTFSAELDSICGSPHDDVLRCVQQVVYAYNASGNPGKFEARRIEGMVHVVPSASVGAAGHLVPRRSVLATPVEISSGTRTLAVFLRDVIAAVAKARGVKIDLMAAPANLLAATVVRPSESSDLASRMLSRALSDVADGRLSWRLLYAPDSGSYMLTLHVVQPHGGK